MIRKIISFDAVVVLVLFFFSFIQIVWLCCVACGPFSLNFSLEIACGSFAFKIMQPFALFLSSESVFLEVYF